MGLSLRWHSGGLHKDRSSFRPTQEHKNKDILMQTLWKSSNPPKRWALCAAENTQLATWALFHYLLLLCFSSPHFYLRELAPCVLAFRLRKVNKTLFTSKTKFLNFLIHNPALDIEGFVPTTTELHPAFDARWLAVDLWELHFTPASCSTVMQDRFWRVTVLLRTETWIQDIMWIWISHLDPRLTSIPILILNPTSNSGIASLSVEDFLHSLS